MTLSNFPDGITSFGIPLMGGGGIPAMYGNVFFVDFANGSDDNDGRSKDTPFKSLGKAHTKATTNNNDLVLLNANGTAFQEDEMLTWSKNRIHVMGLGTFGAVDMQPEIQLSTTGNASVSAATIKVTGYGNTFTNVSVTNSGTDSTSLSALWDAGENTVYTNCQLAKFSDLGETAVANAIGAGDTTTWRNCKFGVGWVTITAARSGLLISGTSGTSRMKHNVFEDCYWVVTSTDANYDHIRINNTDAIAFENSFRNPVFNTVLNASAGGVITTAAVDGGSGTPEASLLFVNPACNCTNFATASTGIKVVGPGMLAHNAGAAVIPTANVGIGITPD